MSKNSETPMMTQFYKIKESVPDCLLFFRMGDFYEMFGDDARIASKVLGIALTSRNKAAENQIPMCGVPHHSYKQYLTKLIAAGYKVAICEQLEDPAVAKGLVKRGVVRIVSQGTIIDEEEIPSVDNIFLLAVYQDCDGVYYLAAADISTGEIYTANGNDGNIEQLITSFSPREIITSSAMELPYSAPVSVVPPKSHLKAARNVVNVYGIMSAEHLGLASANLVAVNMIFDYVKKAMLDVLFSRPVHVADDERLILDSVALKTLDVEESPANKGYSLYSVLNKTSTPMGARLLKWWLTHPSRNLGYINHRLDMVEFFVNNWAFTQEMEKLLAGIYDIERICNRVASKRVTPKEMNWLKESLAELPRIADMLESTGNNKLLYLAEDIHKCVCVADLIGQAIADEPSQTLKEGGIIREKYNATVDELRDIKQNGRQKLADLETKLKKDTGINQLKVSYNKVFGYYIEVSKSNLHKVPDYFERKQTLVNAERFATAELKDLENLILNAEDRLGGYEYELYCVIRDKVAESAALIRKVSKDIGELDCYLAMARVAVSNGYNRPVMTKDGAIEMEGARHPVVEAASGELFIANDVHMNNTDSRLLIITGPNMAGKSTYIRSVAVITLMAHMGSFVPAAYASISLVDRIFTRVGASDNIARGESTFMVEMVETANILTHATGQSLIILDEVGRGTSTYDGVSIAWAVSEYVLNRIKAKTLFATHYHELTDLAENPGVKNYTISVKEQGGEIIFLRKIVPGTADKSYGIYVGKLAGLPVSVIKRAEEVLEALENQHSKARQPSQIIVKKMLVFDEEHPAVELIKGADIDSMTPMQAMNMLYELKKLAK